MHANKEGEGGSLQCMGEVLEVQPRTTGGEDQNHCVTSNNWYQYLQLFLSLQALSQALLQVRADLVDAAQKTLEGEAGKDKIETDVHQLVSQKTQELNVRRGVGHPPPESHV